MTLTKETLIIIIPIYNLERMIPCHFNQQYSPYKKYSWPSLGHIYLQNYLIQHFQFLNIMCFIRNTITPNLHIHMLILQFWLVNWGYFFLNCCFLKLGDLTPETLQRLFKIFKGHWPFYQSVCNLGHRNYILATKHHFSWINVINKMFKSFRLYFMYNTSWLEFSQPSLVFLMVPIYLLLQNVLQ